MNNQPAKLASKQLLTDMVFDIPEKIFIVAVGFK
ncbi:hypothetical protein EV199_1672 [Pseudobacter ginsenosidimutans]|uniref:Uncharacterized protein n=1 Tax=Pseudobacter ginsenosidimutans TaxID=661488 RepID=A0A4Q7N482_9BACT|nr:hypothetical protein EV199_1672 [Pseudobacter ginsenosidimutans]